MGTLAVDCSAENAEVGTAVIACVESAALAEQMEAVSQIAVSTLRRRKEKTS